jgi:hypothetical protein
MRYEVHSAKEHPRVYVDNVRFLEDYNKPSAPAPSAEVTEKLLSLFAESASIPHLSLLHDHAISANDIFAALVRRMIFVNLQTERLDDSGSLVFHRDATVARIHASLQREEPPPLPVPGLVHIAAGSLVRFDNKDYRVVLVGGGQVLLKNGDGQRLTLPLGEVESSLDYVQIDSAQAKI